MDIASIIDQLVETGRQFHRRGWVLATSGNFSARLPGDPLRLLVTRTGADKGALTESDFVVVDGTGSSDSGSESPSAEIALHLAIVKSTGAEAVLHTHSVSATVLSERHARGGSVTISGYEMLKALSGVRSHEHREFVPVIANSQDYALLAREVESTLRRYPDSHGFLLAAHGLYAWGANIAEARRHVECLEFLAEVLVRTS